MSDQVFGQLFWSAVDLLFVQGWRPTDVYIRDNRTFNGNPTWRGVDTGYGFGFRYFICPSDEP